MVADSFLKRNPVRHYYFGVKHTIIMEQAVLYSHGSCRPFPNALAPRAAVLYVLMPDAPGASAIS